MMDWQIRIALIIVGVLVIGFIVFDYQRRKKMQTEKQRLIEQMRVTAQKVDSAGFDFTGVGNVRKSSENEKNVEPVTSKLIEEQAKPPTEQVDLELTNQQTNLVPELVFSLILKAQDSNVYCGKDFMPLLLSQGLRHGEMGIFHRHNTSVSGKPGSVMYSVANAINPGTFELDNIEAFTTPAFAFFMTVPGSVEPLAAYAGMVKTMRLLKQELGGQILDETKSVYTEQTHQHRLDQLQDYLTKASLNKS